MPIINFGRNQPSVMWRLLDGAFLCHFVCFHNMECVSMRLSFLLVTSKLVKKVMNWACLIEPRLCMIARWQCPSVWLPDMLNATATCNTWANINHNSDLETSFNQSCLIQGLIFLLLFHFWIKWVLPKNKRKC